ncbi:hypothetical protein T4B_14532 [Trichinella pseudospiralis]|uniref:Uncharacterized protein n=1 Tax=Trichinella pseudospiralis TaxID=6337 RepID=A0A0V1IZC3_TRIPS|nr:hypothetical protein T4B_14532 [Trichinella pseudospiralis]
MAPSTVDLDKQQASKQASSVEKAKKKAEEKKHQHSSNNNRIGRPTDRPTSSLLSFIQLTTRCKLLVLKNVKISTNRRRKNLQINKLMVGGSQGQANNIAVLAFRPDDTPAELTVHGFKHPADNIRFQGQGELFPAIEKPQHCALESWIDEKPGHRKLEISQSSQPEIEREVENE